MNAARVAIAWTGVLAGSALAEPAPGAPSQSAASLDWQPRSALSPEALARLPGYCEGAYVQPAYGRDGQLPRADLDVGSESGQALPIYLSAGRSSYDVDGQARFEGEVEVQQGNYLLSGEQATYDEQLQQARVEGGVLVRGPSLLVAGSQAQYSVESGYFELQDASYLVHDLELRGTAELISRPSANELVIRDGIYTTCAPHEEDWSLRAERIVLDRAEGVGEAYHAVLRIEDIPVLYVPYINFPIDDRRKSGFLYPSFGTSDTGRGIFLSAPYYFNLAPNYDATFIPSYIHGRGLHSEVEGRYLNEWSKTEARVGFIGQDSEFVKENPGADGQRWGLDFENEITINDRWFSEIDFNAVSDDDYLSDLNRGLRIDSATYLDRFWSLTYASENWAVQSLVQGFQTIDPVIAEADRPFMQLPALTFEGLWLTDNLEYELFSEYSYFWRDNEDLDPSQQYHGSRWRASPRIALPLQQVWGYFVPAVRLDYSSYWLEDRLPGEDRNLDRTVPFVTADAGIFLERNVELFETSLQQTLEPRLFYVYSPFRDQSEIPDFDTTVSTFSYSQLFREDRFVGGDRVGDNNRLSLGITSRFNDLEVGIERARFSLGQIYYFADRRVVVPGQARQARSESVLAGEAMVAPLSNLAVKVEGLWDPRKQKTEQGAVSLNYVSREYDYIFSISHRYLSGYRDGEIAPDEYLEQIDVSALFPVNERLSLIGRWMYSLPHHRTIGTLAGLEYSSCCWRVQLVAESHLDTNDIDAPSEVDRGIYLRFFLRGLTGLGNDLESALGEALVGYQAREQYLLSRERPMMRMAP